MRSELRRLGIGPSEQSKDSAQKRGEAGEDEAQVVAGTAQERVDGVADGAFEVVSSLASANRKGSTSA